MLADLLWAVIAAAGLGIVLIVRPQGLLGSKMRVV